jgi:hypothetical protein
MYVGDHMFSDVIRGKRSLGWRTALVVPELAHEVSAMHIHTHAHRSTHAHARMHTFTALTRTHRSRRPGLAHEVSAAHTLTHARERTHARTHTHTHPPSSRSWPTRPSRIRARAHTHIHNTPSSPSRRAAAPHPLSRLPSNSPSRLWPGRWTVPRLSRGVRSPPHPTPPHPTPPHPTPPHSPVPTVPPLPSPPLLYGSAGGRHSAAERPLASHLRAAVSKE